MKKGFTLIELLVVIAILAILATVTVLVLNPAQLFAQARDSQRITDLGNLKSAISLYLSTATSPSLAGGAGFTCGTNFGSDKAGVSTTFTAATLAHAAVFAVDGSGWAAVNLAGTTGGAPLPVLPRDPVTTGTTYFYGYSCDNTNKTFELNANMESTRYANGGSDDFESTDGGNSATIYETGTDAGLDL